MCDNVETTMAALTKKGVQFTRPIADRGWGLLTSMKLPGAGELWLYQPKHPTAIEAPRRQKPRATARSRRPAAKKPHAVHAVREAEVGRRASGGSIMIRKIVSGGYRLYSARKTRKPDAGAISVRSPLVPRPGGTSARSSSSNAAGNLAPVRPGPRRLARRGSQRLGPLVRTATFADCDRSAAVRSRTAARAWRDSARCEAAAWPLA